MSFVESSNQALSHYRGHSLHEESLLRIPLVREMLDDPNIRLQPRAIDADWTYEKVLPQSVCGFNPSLNAVFYPQKSQFSQWLKAPAKSARPLNLRDFLVEEVLVATHDYLHSWCYQAVNSLVPQARAGIGSVRESEIEKFAFIHILSEAVATVGLDYWYLSQKPLNDVVPLGSVKTYFATKYGKAHERELKHFGIDLGVYNETFFTDLCEFYLSGELLGVDAEVVEKSPLILDWVEHELRYGELQRIYTRQWLQFLSGAVEGVRAVKAANSIIAEKPWQRKLIKQVGALLWRKIVQGEPIRFKRPEGKAWTSPVLEGPIDLRFQNLNSFGERFWEVLERRGVTETSENFLFAQLISKYEYSKLDPVLVKLLRATGPKLNLRELKYLLKDEKPLKGPKENRDLFLLG